MLFLYGLQITSAFLRKKRGNIAFWPVVRDIFFDKRPHFRKYLLFLNAIAKFEHGKADENIDGGRV